jgi:hypothetical protein
VLSIILCCVAISVGIAFAFGSETPAGRAFLLSALGAVAITVSVWFIGWGVPGWFGEWRKISVPTGFCPDCGYDLQASEERCPECGRPIN